MPLHGAIVRGKYVRASDLTISDFDDAYRHSHATHIMEDSKPLMSSYNGEMLTSRKQIREHCARYDLIDGGSPSKTPPKKVDKPFFTDDDMHQVHQMLESPSWRESSGFESNKEGAFDTVPIVDKDNKITGHTSYSKHLKEQHARL